MSYGACNTPWQLLRCLKREFFVNFNEIIRQNLSSLCDSRVTNVPPIWPCDGSVAVPIFQVVEKAQRDREKRRINFHNRSRTIYILSFDKIRTSCERDSALYSHLYYGRACFILWPVVISQVRYAYRPTMQHLFHKFSRRTRGRCVGVITNITSTYYAYSVEEEKSFEPYRLRLRGR